MPKPKNAIGIQRKFITQTSRATGEPKGSLGEVVNDCKATPDTNGNKPKGANMAYPGMECVSITLFGFTYII